MRPKFHIATPEDIRSVRHAYMDAGGIPNYEGRERCIIEWPTLALPWR